MYLTVRDENGREVPDLTQNNFRVLEGKVGQRITSFSHGASEPMTVGLLIDVSGSRRGELHGDEVEPGKAFFQAALRRGDAGFVMAFSDKPYLVAPVTENINELEAAVQRVSQAKAQGSTALFDAIDAACTKVPQRPGRKALVILSDLADNSSHISLDRALQIAQRGGVSIWTIQVTGESTDRREIRRGATSAAFLSRTTGGEPIFVRSKSDLNAAFGAVAADLRDPYVLTYEPTNPARDGRFRKVQVQVPKHLKSSQPAGYYAPKD